MVKSFFIFSLCLTACVVSIPAFADGHYNNQTCQEKEATIQNEIVYAQKQEQQYKISGLEKALKNVKSNCHNENLQKEYQQRVNEKQNKVNERLKELQEAKENGNQSKIANKERKLKAAQNELSAAQTALTSFKNKL